MADHPNERRGSPGASEIGFDDRCADESRRLFLKAAGFGFVGAMMFGCSTAPEERAIPFLEHPEGVIPGRADFYATTCGGCSAGCGILAKSRDGRPLKLEGNTQHPLSRGGLCAVGQASLLGLYDRERLTTPLSLGKASDWATSDAEISRQLAALRARGGSVRYLSGPITSPTKQAAIDAFLADFSGARHVVYDPVFNSAILDAHERTHGLRVFPRYFFDRSKLTVSVDADFLGTWISPVEFTRAHSSRRRIEASHDFCEHIQCEARMSVTGTKADRRYRIAPGERGLLLSHLAASVARQASVAFDNSGLEDCPVAPAAVEEIAGRLLRHRGESLVVCGSDDVESQSLCNFINHVLNNYGTTLDIQRPSYQAQGSEAELVRLLNEISSGRVDALFVDGANPVLDLPGGAELAARIDAIPLLVSFAPRLDETARLADFVCPDHHFLESWSDAENVRGVFSFAQPLVKPIGDTRQVVESLAAWRGKPTTTRALLQERWGDDARWDRLIHDGFTEIDGGPLPATSFRNSGVRSVRRAERPDGGMALVLYAKVGMPNASHAYNPWLHELPDPVTKAVWDNYACLSPAAAERLGVVQGDLLRLDVGGAGNAELPVLVQPGQHDGVVAVALGYGSELSRRFAHVGPQWIERKPTVGPAGVVGVNVVPLMAVNAGGRRFSGSSVNVTSTGRSYELALTQDYHSIDVPAHLAPPDQRRRPNIQETTLAAILHPTTEHGEGRGKHHEASLWPDDHQYTGHHWGMAIDLTTCTGCSACVVACQVENNVPVVGKDEVRRNREMHWIRIDRYYAGEGDDVSVSHQPMMCQHCDNAPCETVCPVLATVHSDEGLNQQVYNRCVGTRYCMNNCPYKVRRFNWFEYAHEDGHANMALNPDITIRSRGVMEKCSLCVQRIQEAKIEAKRLGKTVADGDIQTACQQSCPASAIVFGDMNDPQSALSKLIASDRHYRVLEELNVRPTVGYLEIVRNRPQADGGEHHG